MSRAVTISILTYKRHQHLRRVLASALPYADQVAGIIVVDNAAEPELKSLLAAEYPNVRYIAAPSNAGCESRNIGLRAASTPIVITLDDDVGLSSPNCIAEVETAFSRDPQLACLNFTVIGVDGEVRDWCHPRPISHAAREFETFFILEGMCAFDRAKVLEAGGYPAAYIIYNEGVDLALRLIRRGYRVVHTPRIAVTHYVASEERPGWRLYYYSTRNGIWNCYRSFAPIRAIGLGIGHAAKMGFFAVRARQVPAFLRGCTDALRGLPKLEREPLDHHSLKRVRAMKAERVPLFGRIRRHLRQRIM